MRAVTSSALTKVTSPMRYNWVEKIEFGEGQNERSREAKKGRRTEGESGPSLVRTNLGKLRGGPTLHPPRENLGLTKSVGKVHFLKSENPLSDFRKTFSEIRKALSEIRKTLSEIRKALSEIRNMASCLINSKALGKWNPGKLIF